MLHVFIFMLPMQMACKWHAKCKEFFNRNLELLTQCTLIIILSRSLLFELDSE